MPTPRENSAAIKREALALGFQKVGVAEAGPADPKGHLKRWLADGFDAGMDYMERTQAEREDVTRMVPGARSVVALALSYYHPSADRAPDDDRPRMARYALGDDYHRILKKKVRKLRKRILEVYPEAKVHPGVDTSPVLERAWAQQAGITWTGKSTMAISPELGTYTFLATLITDVPMEPDPQIPHRCGSCTACIDACPTDAIVEPYRVDARKCITYWTVEHRAELSAQTPEFAGWMAGCDVCQDVCPWNKFKVPTQEPRLLPREDMLDPDLSRFETDDEYADRLIAGTALQRTGASALRNNLDWLRKRS